MNIRFSIIIPAYNQARYLVASIESALAQTSRNGEVIVVNDGSTDDTATILAGFGDRIRVVTQTNAGLSAARNAGFRIARGDFLMFLDADDLLRPDAVEMLMAVLSSRSEIDLVIGGWDCIDERGEQIIPWHKPATTEPHKRLRDDFLRTMALGNLFPVHAVLIRRRCFESCGVFDTELQSFEDWDLWLRMAGYGHRAEVIDAPVARYRRHGASMSRDLARMEHAYGRVLTGLFANAATAARLEDVRVHAYIGQWLLLATYAIDAKDNGAFARFVTAATELVPQAVPDVELHRRHLQLATERFPRREETSRLIQAIELVLGTIETTGTEPRVEPNRHVDEADLIVCTVITASHIAHARTLAASLRRHHPGARLLVLLADKVGDSFEPSREPWDWLFLWQLPEPERIERMTFYYSPFELCCALRGMLHRYILEKTTARRWLFLDADMLVCGDLGPALESLDRCSILLNPHNTRSFPSAQVEPNETNLLRAGLYNAGFLGLRRSEETARFVAWFEERLEQHCFDDLSTGHPRRLFVDQLWLNLVPTFFREVGLCVHPGVNLAHWNLSQRGLTRDEAGRYLVDGQPLLLFHFSGWDINRPSQVSRFAPSLNKSAASAWEQLANEYRVMLIANGWAAARQFPYAFGCFRNGREIHPDHRARYFNEWKDGNPCPGSSFEAYDHFHEVKSTARPVTVADRFSTVIKPAETLGLNETKDVETNDAANERRREPMRVMFDVSVLGKGHFDERSRTGIFRVAENLAQGLAASGECDLMFSATQSWDALYQSIEYLRSNPRLRELPLPHSKWKRMADLRKPHIDERIRRHGYPRRAWYRAQRKAFHLMGRIADAGPQPVDVDSLSRCDIFHSPFFPIPERVREIKQVKRFLTVHDLIPILFPHLFAFDEVEVMKTSLSRLDRDDWFCTVSQSTKDDLCNHLPHLDPSRVFVTHLAAAAHFRPCRDADRLRRVRTRYGIPDVPYIASLATVEPRKNLDRLIRAFARLVTQEKLRDLNLVLVGTRGWHFERILGAATETPEVRRRVIFTGYAAEEDLAPILSGAMAFAFVSLYEGFGLPPLEAMQCGVPIIASNTSSLPEVIGDAGLLVDPRDTDMICQALYQVQREESLRRELALRSERRAKQFSWERCTRHTLHAYRTALDRALTPPETISPVEAGVPA